MNADGHDFWLLHATASLAAKAIYLLLSCLGRPGRS
jgi:hypothetical protein